MVCIFNCNNARDDGVWFLGMGVSFTPDWSGLRGLWEMAEGQTESHHYVELC